MPTAAKTVMAWRAMQMATRARAAMAMAMAVPERRAELDAARLARGFHALSDEKRLRILTLLRGGERCVCELTEALDAGQSLLSFHLKTLKDAGLVNARRQGRWMYYSADAGAVEELEAALGDLAPTGARAPRAADDRCG
ncbi:MAG: ArsR/SmtB family transcription factor [Gemmatimonadota bacterium]